MSNDYVESRFKRPFAKYNDQVWKIRNYNRRNSVPFDPASRYYTPNLHGISSYQLKGGRPIGTVVGAETPAEYDLHVRKVMRRHKRGVVFHKARRAFNMIRFINRLKKAVPRKVVPIRKKFVVPKRS